MVQWSQVDMVRSVLEEASMTPEAALRALAVVDEAKASLVEAEAELIAAARGAGVTWRGIAEALDLASPQAAAQRALRLQRRVPVDRRSPEDGRSAPVTRERGR